MKRLKILLTFLIFSHIVLGQITPPGTGKANTANWLALGLRQELDTVPGNEWQSMTYVGFGQKSNPDNNNPFYKPAIFILNQEFYHRFHKAWQYSVALSYRRQDEYLDISPYKHATPKIEQEFRAYGRFSYLLKSSRIEFIPTFRQDLRKFYAPDFDKTSEDFQFRSRFRLQFVFHLNKNKTQKLVANSEQLFSISKMTTANQWTNFGYRESRFSFYYSLSPKALPLTLNIGYMNNLVGSKTVFDVHHFAFDIIVKNPINLVQGTKRPFK